MIRKKETRDQDIANKLAAYNKQTHIVRENIADSIQVFRVEFVSTFLCSSQQVGSF